MPRLHDGAPVTHGDPSGERFYAGELLQLVGVAAVLRTDSYAPGIAPLKV